MRIIVRIRIMRIIIMIIIMRIIIQLNPKQDPKP